MPQSDQLARMPVSFAKIKRDKTNPNHEIDRQVRQDQHFGNKEEGHIQRLDQKKLHTEGRHGQRRKRNAGKKSPHVGRRKHEQESCCEVTPGDHSRSVHVAIPVSSAANSATTSSYKFLLYSNQCRAETGRNVIVKAIFKAGFFQSR